MVINAPGSRAPWLASDEAAQYLGVNVKTVMTWARRGKLKGYRLSGTTRVTWRFLIEDLDASIIGAPAVLPKEASCTEHGTKVVQ